MSKLHRMMVVVAVVYLATVGALYMMLAQRDDHFLKSGQTITGVVTAIRPAPNADSGAMHGLIQPSGSTVADVRYTDAGRTGTTTTSPYSSSKTYRVGQKVTLVIHRADSGNAADDVIAVKDHTAAGLRAIPYGFFIAAAAVAWYFGVLPHRIAGGRRPRLNGRSAARPETP